MYKIKYSLIFLSCVSLIQTHFTLLPPPQLEGILVSEALLACWLLLCVLASEQRCCSKGEYLTSVLFDADLRADLCSEELINLDSPNLSA